MTDEALIRRNTLLAVVAASFLTPFMGSSIDLAIPSIGKQFGANAFLLGWMVASYLLASAAFLLPFGKVADIIGRRKVFVAGISGFTLFSLLCGFSQSIKMLIALRVFQGISSAMIFGTGMAILTSVFPASERGRVLGINTAAVYTGLSLGPVLGGAINHFWGWRFIFYTNAAVGVAALHFIRKLKGDWRGAEGQKLDWAGSVMCAGLLYGVSSIARSTLARAFVGAGIVLLFSFIVYEGRVKSPLLDLKLFNSNAVFAFSNLAALINYSATFAVGYMLSVYLQLARGFDSQKAGMILLAQPIVMAALSPLAGRLSDRVEPRKIASAGMAIMVICLIAFAQIGPKTPPAALAAVLLFFGGGLALFSSPNTNAVMSAVDRRDYGIASSTLGTMRLIGQAVSMAIVTLVMTAHLGNVELAAAPTERLLSSIGMVFYILAALSFGGIFASLARGNLRKAAAMPQAAK